MTAIAAPNALFHSVFKNVSGAPLWVAFIPPWGRTVKPGAVFTVPGDPRYSDDRNSWPRWSTIAKSLVASGKLEFLQSPLPIMDNRVDDGKSLTIMGNDNDLFVTETVTPVEEAAARILPVVTPTVVYDAMAEQFTVDWSAFATEFLLSDTFDVMVLCPDKTEERIQAYRDKGIVYNAMAGLGDYTFTFVLTAVDGRTQEGTPVTETIA